MITDVFMELAPRLPLRIDDCQQDSETLYLGGPGWSLRISGPWRLSKSEVIEASNGAELRADMAGNINSVINSEIVDIQPQSRFNSLDIALLMRDGRVLEVFSDYIYDNWLLTFQDVAIEGPLQSSEQQ
ncbi:hypothetical protein ACIRPT_15890 [Streptomyces sp. NPDC101227]|uniref:hypothetical protein n=1 Tax=Streptomyces sp. NPDC101227 TaxID=3366136 RepID=UPI0038011FCA